MSAFLLDSNTVIFFLKGRREVVERWAATAPNQMATSAVVWHELVCGATILQRPEARLGHLDRLREVLRVLPLTVSETSESAKIRAELARTGNAIGPLDTLIAGTARLHGLAVVTNNVREFTRVPGLAVRDWTLPG